MDEPKIGQRSINSSLAKSAGIIGAATFLSRILGFLRDIIMASYFGTAKAAQAFVVAFRIPNILRDLVGEGATNAAFVPVFSEYLVKKKREEFWRLAAIVLSLFLVTLSLVTILGVILSPLIVRLIAPGFVKDSELLLLTIKLARIMFPFLILIGLSAYAMGILHSFKSFAAPAFGPCLLNVVLIGSLLLASTRMKEPVLGLAFGVLIGGTLQLAIQLPSLYKRGLGGKPSLLTPISFVHPGVRKIGTLLLPRALGSAVYQFNVFVDTILASLFWIVGKGGVAAIYYANRIIQFPLAIFGIALSQAALPTLSSQAAKNDLEKLKATVSFSLRSIFLVMIPSCFGLMILSQPITKVLFQRGNFSAYSTSITSWALLFYSFGLFAYGGIKVLVSCFYALQDTFTPVKTASLCLIVNIVLNLILMWPLGVGGLALASSISATLNFLLLFSILNRRIGRLDKRQLIMSFSRITLASLVMGLVILLGWRNLLLDSSQILRLALAVLGGVLIFCLACFILKVREIRGVTRWLLNRG